MSVKAVSLEKFKREAKEILRLVGQGETLVLTYRGIPMARLAPLAADDEDLSNDPIYSLCDQAADDGTSFTNQEIDDLIYGA